MFNKKKAACFFQKKAPRYVLLGALLLAAGCAKGTQSYGNLGGSSTEIPFSDEVRAGTLPSGLTYYIMENHKPENRAFITLAVNAGSVNEDDDEQGLAHFVEHMAFKGGARFSGSGIIDYLRSLGMRFGADVNAYTAFDRTVYGIEVPVSTNEQGIKTLPSRALEIFDDWSHTVSFNEADVNDERRVIQEEHRARLGVGERSMRSLFELLFAGSKYARRFPIGLMEIVENAPAEKLKSFYQKWYRADTMALIFIGDFDGAALEASLTDYFTIGAPQTPLALPKITASAPKKGALSAQIFTDPELTSNSIALYYRERNIGSEKTLEDYRNLLMRNLIARIIEERWLDEEDKLETPFFGAYTGEMRTIKEMRYYVIGARAKTGLVKESLAALLREKERIERYGFLESEIERAKQTVLAGYETALAEKEKRDSGAYLDDLTRHFLRGEAFPHITWELEAVKTMLPGMRAKDLHAAVKEYFLSDDLIVFVMAPAAEASSLPSVEEIEALARQAKKEKIEKPSENALSGDFLKTEPRPGSISAESFDQASKTVLWELSNGARVLLKTTENQNDHIVMNAAARGGTTSAALEQLVSAKLASEIVGASGVGDWKLPELNKKLAGKQVSLSFYTSAWTRGIEGGSTTGDLPSFFQFLYLGFTAPRVDQDAAAILQDRYRTELARREENPEAYFNDELSAVIYQNNPYFMPLKAADLDKIDLAAVREWTRRCLNPADYTFVFTGNIDLAVMRELVCAYIASIPPAETPFRQWAALSISFPETLDRRFTKGKDDKSIVYLGHLGNASWTMKDAMAVEILQEYLDISLTEEIREKRGGVYNVSVESGLSPLPPPGELALQIYFTCSPSRVDELSVAIEAELAKIASGLIDMDTFTKARSALQKSWESSLESNSYIARRLASYSVVFEIPLETLYRRGEYYENTTPQDLRTVTQAALRRGLVRAALYPER
jgi:zinc protease